jgi:hypothetical protein
MTDPIDPSADTLRAALDLLNSAERQKRYRTRRRTWAWKIGRPYSEDLDKPLPAVVDGVDPENG